MNFFTKFDECCWCYKIRTTRRKRLRPHPRSILQIPNCCELMSKRKRESQELGALPSSSKVVHEGEHQLEPLKRRIVESIALLHTFQQTFETHVKDISIGKKESQLRNSKDGRSNIDGHEILTDELTDAIMKFDASLKEINILEEESSCDQTKLPSKILKAYDGEHSTNLGVGIVKKLIECRKSLAVADDTEFILRNVKNSALKISN